jgi:hypothetical protein
MCYIFDVEVTFPFRIPNFEFLNRSGLQRLRILAVFLTPTKNVGQVRGPFDKFVDWRQCAAVMQREALTLIPSFSGGGNVVVV